MGVRKILQKKILLKNFFSSLNMYQAKSGVKKIFGKKFFFQSEHVSSQIWCQKFFPLLGGGAPCENFFSSLNMYQAKSGVKKNPFVKNISTRLHTYIQMP